MSPQTQTIANRIVDSLVQRRAIPRSALDQAQLDADEAGVRLESYLVEHKLVSDVDMALAFSDYLNLPPIQLRSFAASGQLLQLIPQEMMQRHSVVPVARVAKMLTVAMADPFDVVALDQIQAITGMELVPVIAPESRSRTSFRRTPANRRAAWKTFSAT